MMLGELISRPTRSSYREKRYVARTARITPAMAQGIRAATKGVLLDGGLVATDFVQGNSLIAGSGQAQHAISCIGQLTG